MHGPLSKGTTKGLGGRQSEDLEGTVPLNTLTTDLFLLRSQSVLISFQ